jgi:hypothetical protein
MIDVKIRYNTNCEDNHLFWRILIDGVEEICSNVIINVPVHTTRDVVYDPSRAGDVDKHHISCKANEVVWKGDVVIVR